MAKDIIVNGERRDAVSFIRVILATGGKTLFRDVDEASGSINGIMEIATGSFSVAAATASYTIKHNMSIAPDVAVCTPRFWYDTLDNNLGIAATSKYVNATGGRRSVADNSSHFAGGINGGTDTITDTEIKFIASVYGKFQPTYTDADGNTGTQEYLWVAVKFAE